MKCTYRIEAEGVSFAVYEMRHGERVWCTGRRASMEAARALVERDVGAYCDLMQQPRGSVTVEVEEPAP